MSVPSGAAEARGAAGARPRRRRPPVLYGLHLGALWSLAVAQPILDLLGQNAEFFAIRRSAPVDIVLLAVALVAVPPLVLYGVEALVAWIDVRAMEVLHLVLVGALVAVLALTILKRTGGSTVVLAPLSVAAGAGAAVLYRRAQPARSLLSFLVPAPIIVAVLFLLGSPVHELVLGTDAEARLVADNGRAPVVMVLLDELPLTTLLGGDGRIDERRFPAFAGLARDAHWFRRVATVDSFTQVAVPAVLTGRVPEAGTLPTFEDHPDNLFTLLGRGRRLNVHESITSLCPEELCPREREAFGSRMRSLAADVGVVSLHVLLPDDVRRGLPAIDRSWQDFGGGEGDDAEGADQRTGRPAAAFEENLERQGAVFNRADAVRRFAARVPQGGPGARPGLSFLHVLLPHRPWLYLPDGRRYSGGDQELGLVDGRWSQEPGGAEAAHQRLLLQAMFTDRLLGELLERLRRTGVYDKAMVVVTADHGAALRPGQQLRGAEADNAGEILPVPLFIKAPGQRRARVVDTQLQTIDVLPTMADMLGVRIPFRVDGRSAFAKNAGRAKVRVTQAGSAPVTVGVDELDRQRAAAFFRQIALFGEGGFPRLRSADSAALVGRRVAGLRRVPAHGASATLDAAGAFAAVDRAGTVLPVHVTGELEGTDAAEVAIALNGRIGAVAHPVRDGDRRGFAAVLPPSLLRDGANRVEVLAVGREGGRPVLTPLVAAGAAADGTSRSFRLVGDALVAPDGRRLRIGGGGGVRGYVDRSERDDELVRLNGWAVDAAHDRPVDQIVGFAGDRLLFAGAPSLPRPDIGRDEGTTGEDLGFGFEVARDRLDGAPRVFAVRGDEATPIDFYCAPGARQAIGC